MIVWLSFGLNLLCSNNIKDDNVYVNMLLCKMKYQNYFNNINETFNINIKPKSKHNIQ